MFVSQKIIIVNRDGKILAIRRSKTDPSRPLTWDLPGGVLEEGEDLLDNIKRETREEAGIEVNDISILDATANYVRGDEYWVQIAYRGKVDMPDVILSYEHDKYQWISKEEFLRLESSEKIKRFLTKI